MRGTISKSEARKRFVEDEVNAMTAALVHRGHSPVRWLGEAGKLRIVKCQDQLDSQPYFIHLSGKATMTLAPSDEWVHRFQDLPTHKELKEIWGFYSI